MKTHERYKWATEIINLKADEHALEIGCGTGILVKLLLENPTAGNITAIDKSTPMANLTFRKNETHIRNGKLKVLTIDFLNTNFHTASFDKIFSFNVNTLWNPSKSEYALIKKYLKPGGSLFIFHQPPYKLTKQAAEIPVLKLKEAEFTIEDIILKPTKPFPSLCIVAKR